MKKNSIIMALSLGLIFGLNASAADHKMKTAAKTERMAVNESDLKWGPAPPVFQPGMKMTVLMGDPSKAGEYTIRAKIPKDYKIGPHWHPTQENITIISGTFNLGMGTKFDDKKGMSLGVGGFAQVPAKHAHFAWTTEESEIQVHGMGPFKLIYINKADDPSIKKAAAKKK